MNPLILGRYDLMYTKEDSHQVGDDVVKMTRKRGRRLYHVLFVAGFLLLVAVVTERRLRVKLSEEELVPNLFFFVARFTKEVVARIEEHILIWADRTNGLSAMATNMNNAHTHLPFPSVYYPIL